MNNNKKKVLFICSAQSWYVRNQQIISILEKHYSVNIVSSSKNSYIERLLYVYYKFITLKEKKKYDFVFVGFLCQPLIPLVRFFYKGRVISDFFISIYDTVCNDRKKIKADSLLGKIIFKYERFTINLSDKILVDTQGSRKYIEDTYKTNKAIDVIYVLPDLKLFKHQDINKSENRTTVFFYGSCQPLHGIDVILKAAALFNDKNDIRFKLIGPIRKNYSRLVKNINPNNIILIDWVDYTELPLMISCSDICLGGHFSNNEKAKRVIAGKTFQFAAVKKSIILGDNLANKELFLDQEDCIMVEVNNPENLRDAIVKLNQDQELRAKIANNAYVKTIKLAREQIIK